MASWIVDTPSLPLVLLTSMNVQEHTSSRNETCLEYTPLQGELKLDFCTSSLLISNRCLPTSSYNVIVFLTLPCYLTSQMCFSQYSAFHVHDDTLVQTIWKKKGTVMKKKLVARSTKRKHNFITTCFSFLFWFLRLERERWLERTAMYVFSSFASYQ